MEMILKVYMLVKTNGDVILGLLFGLWGVVEAIVRITPTKKDDTALERVGKFLKGVLDALGIPNRRAVEVEIKGDKKDEKAA